MVEGVVAANRLAGQDAEAARRLLWEAVAAAVEGEISDAA